MGYNMKRGAAPKFKELGSSPVKQKDIGAELQKKYKGEKQTTDVEGKKITPTSKYGPGMHKGHDNEDLRGKLKKGSAPQHRYHLKENLTQEERARLLKDPDYKKSMALNKEKTKEKGFMQPPYKDTVEGTRPYEKRQAYHGFKVQPDIPVKPKDKEMKEFSDLEKYDDDKS